MAKDESNSDSDTKAESGIEVDTVYGALDKANYKKTSESLYLDEERDVLFLLAGDEIFQVEINFDPALGIDIYLDKSFLTNHAFDYMAEDAKLIQTVSDKEFVYESAILGKKYTVVFSG